MSSLLLDLNGTLIEFFGFFPQFFKCPLLRPADSSDCRHLAEMLLRLVSGPVLEQQSTSFALLEAQHRRLAFPFAASFSHKKEN